MKMRRKMLGLLAGTLAMAGVSGLCSIDAVAAAAEPPAETAAIGEGSVDPMQSPTYWVFETRNGVKYRRLYDSKNKKWLTDWIRC